MKTMKTFIKLGIVACFCTTGYAQEGVITIEQDQKIEDAILLYKSTNVSAEIYRIQFGFGSHQKAQNIKSNVELDFPELYPKVEFKSPSYRVRGGRFKTKLEAERTFSEVRKKYPSAMLLKPKKTTP